MHNVSNACRSCGEVRLKSVLTLGKLPLANRLITEDQLGSTEPAYPLELVLCPRCSLVQITETVPPEELFRNYVYFSSFSEGVLKHARQLAGQIIASQKLRPSSLVIEIGSNDGYLLQNYQAAGIPVLGIEPAVNVARVAQDQNGIPTLCKFFNRDLAAQLAGCDEKADVVHIHNVLAHVADLNGFVAGMHIVLKDTGLALVEVPYVKDLIDNVEFDTIYHEHLCYFSLTSLTHLFEKHGLRVLDVERTSIHGGSLRLYIGKTGCSSARVAKLLDDEAAWGVAQPSYYQGFGQRIDRLRHDLVKLLRELKSQGRRIAVYGASAKGSMLLNYFQIGRDLVDFAVDRNTFKQGRYTPGTHLKIHSPEKLVEDRPDYVLLLSWNFVDEILQQQTAYRQQGGRFIIPIPQLKVA